MRIISKHKDYYDSSQAYGIDNTIIYKRNQESFKVEKLSNFDTFNERIWKALPELNSISTVDPTQSKINIKYTAIGFCGEIYPCIRFVKLVGNEIESIATFYNTEDVIKHLQRLEHHNPNLSYKSEFYRCEKLTRNEWSKYFTEGAFKKTRIEWFQEVQSPYFVFDEEPYEKHKSETYKKISNQSSLAYIRTNPVLKNYHFYKVKDSISCHQTISQFLSGVLTTQEITKDTLTDTQKVKQYGFDERYGFRKRPKK